MKKLLCFLGIIIIIFLVLLPPMLRIFLKDKDEKSSTFEVEITSYLLYCTNEEFVVINTYEEDKTTLINIKRLIQDDEEYEYQTGSGITNFFDNIKALGDSSYQKMNDGELITINTSNFNNSNISIKNFTNEAVLQKTYYQNQGLNCEIRK